MNPVLRKKIRFRQNIHTVYDFLDTFCIQLDITFKIKTIIKLKLSFDALHLKKYSNNEEVCSIFLRF